MNGKTAVEIIEDVISSIKGIMTSDTAEKFELKCLIYLKTHVDKLVNELKTELKRKGVDNIETED